MKKSFLICLLLFITSAAFTQKYIEGHVIKVADGDTFTIIDKYKKKTKIRLHGIDSPEKGQAFYQTAKSFTSQKVFDKRVRIEVQTKDRYGRVVGTVWLNKKNNFNLELIKSGLAWDYPIYSKNKTYQQAEKLARSNKLNIWSQPSPLSPWEFRKQKKTKKKADIH